MVQVHRFLNEIERAFLHRRDRVLHRAERGDQNHRNGGIGLLGFAQNVQSGTARHFQVGQHQQVSARANLGDRGIAVGGFIHRIAGTLQCFAQHGAQFRLVLRQKQRFQGGSLSAGRGIGALCGICGR